MEKSMKSKVLDSIGKIYEESSDCKLEDAFFSNVDKELTFLSRYFGTSKNQAFLTALVFALNYKGDTVDYNDLIVYFRCNPMTLLRFNDDFEILHSKGFLKKKKSTHRILVSGTNDQYFVNERITEAILNNKPIPKKLHNDTQDVYEVLEQLYNYGLECYEDEISPIELYTKANALLSDNLQFPLIKKVESLKLNFEDKFLYLYIIWKTLLGNETTDLNTALKGIFSSPASQLKYLQEFFRGNNALLKNNWAEMVEARFSNDAEIKLTKNSFNLMQSCGLTLFINDKKNENVITPDKITYRKLIFSETEMKQLFLLKDLLKENKFRKAQKQLASKNMPKGITALLHGTPGTGKTELVKQIAKETSREIMKVEISQSKSMWFGESEKIIKRIFTDYHTYAKTCKRTPILFFNEADAIFSKRKATGSSNVDQTENTIQNIILEELENFEGILIATTNLTNNFDAAFERRFLFKIPFQKPDISIRTSIWKMKLPFLALQECNVLAEKFDFSGGQIDNVLRKNEIHEIIRGAKVTLDQLMIFCSEETIVNRVKIGFNSL